jgi:hypothetical protein
MTAPLRTARVLREERRARTSLHLRGALERHGVTQAHVAADTGAGPTKVAQWCDPEADSAISVADAQVLPPAIRLELAELILGPGMCAAVLPAAERIADDVHHAARIAQGGGVVVSGLLAAVADGHIDRAEAADVRARVLEHIRELVSLERGLAEIERQNGAPVRRLRAAGAGR